MSKKKWMKLLIGYTWGSPSNCSHHSDRNATFIIHEKFEPLDLRDYYRQYGEQEFPRAQQRAMRKIHPKQADERFVCTDCHRSTYLGDGMRYDEDGQADFTSVELEVWRKKDYRKVEDAVLDFLIKQKSN